MSLPPSRRRTILFGCVLAITIVCGAAQLLVPAPTPVQQVALPSRVRIPAINVDAPIIPLGMDDNGQMHIPSNPSDVGWFAPGIIPGSTGSAVFAGHLNTAGGGHGVFWNLHTLKPSDTIAVESGSGQTLLFSVTTSQSYPYNEAPMQEIFSASGGRILNLITCTGTWEGATYDQRLVVTAVLAERSK